MTNNERKAADAADLADAMVVLGLLLLGVAIGLAWGLTAVAAYAGVLLIVFGGALAIHRGHNGRS